AAPDQAGSTAPRAACAVPRTAHTAHCFAVFRGVRAERRLSATVAPAAARTPAGYWPSDVRAAYKLPTSNGAGQTIAIVDAYDNPKVERDLGVYRARFGLPACTTANGCFRKVNQGGKVAPLPPGDPGWGLEMSLDVDAVSAACPKCHLLLVEGNSASLDDLGAAVDTAVRLGADAVSNSYGTDEFNGIAGYAHYYRHPGVPILVSSGDYGFTAAQFPAVLSSAIAVGGTTLRHAGNARGWTERAWSGAGSGCSAYIAKPSWQHDQHCLMRVTADVSAVADPNTGLAVYDTYGLGADNGWIVVGGTSASSPLLAGMYGLAGNGGRADNASGIYAHPGGVYDVVGGSNGFCGGDYLCTGVRGYDGPTGVGSPHGLGAL
ncbi:MAG: S53 family peptidase, partial [Mycobacteriales bacterium]